MDDWLIAIEQLGPVQALKTSFLAYPLVSALHVAAIGGLIMTVLLIDLRLLGLVSSVPQGPFVALLRRVALLSFAVAALTGAALFAVRASTYAGSGLFLAKMGLIALAGLNFAAFMQLDSNRTAAAPLSGLARATVIVSLVTWPAVLVCGRFLGFV